MQVNRFGAFAIAVVAHVCFTFVFSSLISREFGADASTVVIFGTAAIAWICMAVIVGHGLRRWLSNRAVRTTQILVGAIPICFFGLIFDGYGPWFALLFAWTGFGLAFGIKLISALVRAYSDDGADDQQELLRKR